MMKRPPLPRQTPTRLRDVCHRSHTHVFHAVTAAPCCRPCARVRSFRLAWYVSSRVSFVLNAVLPFEQVVALRSLPLIVSDLMISFSWRIASRGSPWRNIREERTKPFRHRRVRENGVSELRIR